MGSEDSGKQNLGEREDVESIMGQYFFAIGAGATGQWIRREATTYIREHYRKSIKRALKTEDWTQDAPRVLHYLNVVGRLAAHKTTIDGRDAITKSDISEAILAVENNYKEMLPVKGKEAGTHVVTEGKWCGGGTGG